MASFNSPAKLAETGGAAVWNPSGNDWIRIDTYSLLAALLRSPPAADLLGMVRRLDPAGVPGVLSEAWQDLIQAGEQYPPDRIQDDFGRLFVGLGCGEIIPYASWYDDGLLMSRALARLRPDLQRLGLTRRAGVTEPEDHTAALCETMAVLAGPGGVDCVRQREFFNKHINPWMARFFDDIRKAGSPGFYGAVGNLGSRFMKYEQAFFSADGNTTRRWT